MGPAASTAGHCDHRAAAAAAPTPLALSLLLPVRRTLITSMLPLCPASPLVQAVPGADKWRPWHGQPMYAPEGPDPGQGGDGGREWEQTMHASRGKAPAVQGPKCASDAWAAPLAAAEGALETGDGAEQRFTVS